MNRETDIVAYLKSNLKDRIIGREIYYFESVSSTMDVARELADRGAAEGTAVIAGIQKTGRGRLGRSWLTPKGSLAVSIILKPPQERLRYLPAISSLAVLQAIKNFGIAARIKWPNDVLIEGRKVSGILIENAMEAETIRYSIVGIGINVNFNSAEYPEIARISTGIAEHLKAEISVAEVAFHLLSELEVLYIKTKDMGRVTDNWLNNMETIGKRIRVNTGNAIKDGIAESVNAEGNLILRLDDGSAVEIIAGDVTLVKD